MMNLSENIIFRDLKINCLAKAKIDFEIYSPPAKAGSNSGGNSGGNLGGNSIDEDKLSKLAEASDELPQALDCGLKKGLLQIGFSQILILNQLKEAVR